MAEHLPPIDFDRALYDPSVPQLSVGEWDEAQRDACGGALRNYADAMGLVDWTVTLMHGWPPPDFPEQDKTDAAVRCSGNQRDAYVWLHPNFLRYNGDRQQYLLLHELAHLLVMQLDDLVTGGALPDQLGEAFWSGWVEGYDQALEYAVDRMARAWALQLPPIRWPRAAVSTEPSS